MLSAAAMALLLTPSIHIDNTFSSCGVSKGVAFLGISNAGRTWSASWIVWESVFSVVCLVKTEWATNWEGAMGACCLSAYCSKISGMTPQLIKKGLIGGLECVSLIKLYKSAITRCGFHCKICSFANRRLLIPDTRNEELNLPEWLSKASIPVRVKWHRSITKILSINVSHSEEGQSTFRFQKALHHRELRWVPNAGTTPLIMLNSCF